MNPFGFVFHLFALYSLSSLEQNKVRDCHKVCAGFAARVKSEESHRQEVLSCPPPHANFRF